MDSLPCRSCDRPLPGLVDAPTLCFLKMLVNARGSVTGHTLRHRTATVRERPMSRARFSNNRTRMRILFYLLSLGIVLAQDPRTESYLGNLAPVIRSIQQERDFPMDYAHRQGMSVGEWRARGRAELQRTLS